ncbi:MAG: class I SAM-dependent methyltransferase [Chloroflexi bacterium]|nr:class I SAM-dependent methyltransferase [Chloroflexota bacterium]
MADLILQPGRDKSLLRRHPWVFSGAIESILGNPQPGETINILDAKHHFLAKAAYSPASQIRARVWTFDEDEDVDTEFFRRKIDSALALRSSLGLFVRPSDEIDQIRPVSDAVRLIHAESDHLPGLIVDSYANVLVLQSLTAGSEFWREVCADILLERTGAQGIYERSDADVRELEGLSTRIGALRGNPPERLLIAEHGLQFLVNIVKGHKTGFYLDQRQNRRRIGELAMDRDVLNCFCYTGGFSLQAAVGGAKTVLSVDSSADALALAQENAGLNPTSSLLEWREADVFQALRKFRDERRSFDMIILDPPKFAATVSQAEKAARGYKDINLLAFKLLRPGGILATFSCSGGIGPELFQKIVAGAALDAGVDATIVEHMAQAGDHPISLHFPEGAYLKGLICIKN